MTATVSATVSVPVLVLLLACGTAAPCATSASCAAGTTCHPDGTCAPLEAQARFARARWLDATEWGATRGDRPSARLPATDVLPLGGEANAFAYLAFGPLPADAAVSRAWLVLHPHPSFAGPAEGAVVLAYWTRPFEGRLLDRRSAPRAVGAAIAERPVVPGGPRPIVLDLTDAVRHAQRAGRSRIWLLLRASGADRGPPWHLASPRAVDHDLRPQLQLSVR